MLLELEGIGLTNWCSRISSVLERTGLDQTLELQNIGYLMNQLLEYLHSSGENILSVRVSCAHMH